MRQELTRCANLAAMLTVQPKQTCTSNCFHTEINATNRKLQNDGNPFEVM